MNTSRKSKGSANAVLHTVTTAVAVGLLAGVAAAQPKPRAPSPPLPSPGLLYQEGFNQPYQMPAHQVVDSAIWTEGWSGWSLNRTSQRATVAPWIVPMLSSNQTWNLDPQRGALRWWYCPEYGSGKGPGKLARLMTLVSLEGKMSATWWSLAITEDGCAVRLLCETEKDPIVCAEAPVDFQAGSWHLVTLGYTETNSAVFVDDQQVAVGEGLPTVPVEAAPFTSLIIGSGLSGEVAAGQIDEFAAFTGRARPFQRTASAFGIDPPFEIVGCWARLSPIPALGPVTPQEEAAQWERLIQQRADSLATKQAAALTLAEAGGQALDGGGSYSFMQYTNGVGFEVPQIAGTNLTLTLSGTATNKSYNVLASTVLPAANWVTLAIGNLGQTNFTVPFIGSSMFYRAEEGDNWDGDEAKNWQDADPSNPNVGFLRVTIEQPANGAIVQ